MFTLTAMATFTEETTAVTGNSEATGNGTVVQGKQHQTRTLTEITTTAVMELNEPTAIGAARWPRHEQDQVEVAECGNLEILSISGQPSTEIDYVHDNFTTRKTIIFKI